MPQLRTSTLVFSTLFVGVTAMCFAACGTEPSAPTTPTGTGGSLTNSDDDDSSSSVRGGKSNSSQANANNGGASDSDEQTQGGSSSDSDTSSAATRGGNSSSSKSASARGGSSAKSTTTKAAGGTSSDANSSKATGGTSSVKTGSAKGGSAAKSGSSSASSSSTATSSCSADDEKFSFFITSQAALVKLSGNADGFGGDLGGLTGADEICQTIAEASAPCHQGKVVWHAFLSTSAQNARDRIGKGPWYDRRGRLLAKNLTDLINERPVGADTAIVNDFPNENGTTNHSPEGKLVDNHQTITGSGTDGKIYTQSGSGSSTGGGIIGGGMPGGFSGAQDACLDTWSVDAATCKGWTTKEPYGCPRVGHSWFEGAGMSGKHWISVWNESGCAPGGTGEQIGGTDSSRKIGSAGGYGGFYCFAVTGE